MAPGRRRTLIIILIIIMCTLLAFVYFTAQGGQPRTETGLKVVVPALKINLGMMDQSIDDMYSGCTKEMAEKVQTKYFPREMKESSFKNAWESAANCVKTAKKKQEKIDKALTSDHLQAIYVYTAEKPSVYPDFNVKVRTSAKQYNSESFKYHALHFWLTSAIQTLRENNPKPKCHQTVRRSKDTFTGEMNQIIRFGSFASTSYQKNLYNFGNETCFSITTCLGAYLKEYSAFAGEEEVLIPPYEMFKITEITTAPYDGIEHCKIIYVLKSADKHSKLNCKACSTQGDL